MAKIKRTNYAFLRLNTNLVLSDWTTYYKNANDLLTIKYKPGLLSTNYYILLGYLIQPNTCMRNAKYSTMLCRFFTSMLVKIMFTIVHFC